MSPYPPRSRELVWWIGLMVALITFYGVWKLQGVMMDSEQYYNDPRHPRCMTLKELRDWLFCLLDADCLVKHGGAKSSEKPHVVKETAH
jgi:ATP synthase j chain